MEFVESTIKRKKRKTRKHLNEIRKRSRNCLKSIDVNNLMHSERQSDCKHSLSKSNLVTSDRLTLAIFPKVIQSDTVTRHSIMEHSEESENCLNTSCKIVTKSNYVPLAEKALSSDENCSVVERCSDLEQLSPCEKNSIHSINLLSKSKCLKSDQFSSLEENSCREIMDNMSHYLGKMTKKKKEFISSPTKENIGGHAINNSCTVSEELWSSGDPSVKEFRADDPIEVSTLQRIQGDSPTLSSSCPISRDILRDSPEYIYYPHKLN